MLLSLLARVEDVELIASVMGALQSLVRSPFCLFIERTPQFTTFNSNGEFIFNLTWTRQCFQPIGREKLYAAGGTELVTPLLYFPKQKVLALPSFAKFDLAR